MQDAVVNNIADLKEQYGIDDTVIEELKRKNKQRVVTVSELPKGMLWKPGIGGENNCQVIVELSRQHPFMKRYIKIGSWLRRGCNLDAFFLNMAMAEMGINCDDNKYAKYLKNCASRYHIN